MFDLKILVLTIILILVILLKKKDLNKFNKSITGTIFIIVVLFFIYFFRKENNREHFIDNINIDSMNQKINDLEEKEKETRMFCKLLRHKDKKEEMDYMVQNSNMKFRDNWDKQNQMISDIKKKIINLKLDKVDKDFIDFNNNKNNTKVSNQLRKRQIEAAKKKLNGPRSLNLTLNNKLLKLQFLQVQENYLALVILCLFLRYKNC